MIDAPQTLTHFQVYRQRYADAATHFEINLGALDYYRFADTKVPLIVQGHRGRNVHRCHLAEDFVRARGIDVDPAEVVVTRGVRESLALLMSLWAGRSWGVPTDTYPTYIDIASQRCPYTLYRSPAADPELPLPAVDVLLVCLPFKPFGIDFSDRHVDALLRWLDEDPARRLVIDAVYLFRPEACAPLGALMATGRAVALYSLSKAYGVPGAAGFTFGLGDALPGMRAAAAAIPPWPQMKDAYALLTYASPDRLQRRLRVLNARLRALPGFEQVAVSEENPSYLYRVREPVDELAGRGVLAVPPRVFGLDGDGAVISTLGLAD